jgi:glycosyltransferase involved in cell wall biosynthesis
MANKLPKVSIIIPYRIDRGWLNEAIESVKNQTYKGEIELILSQSENSVSYNINEGVKKSTGDYIKYLCEDDRLTKNSIEDSVRVLENYDFIHGDAINFFPNGAQRAQKPLERYPKLSKMLLRNVIHGGTLMYKRECFEERGFDESLNCAEEYDFNLYLLSKGCRVGYVNTFLYEYRRHDEQKSLGKGIDQHERGLRIEKIKDKYR